MRTWQQLSQFLSWKTHEWVDLNFVLWKLRMFLLWITFILTFTTLLFKLHYPLIPANKGGKAILSTFLLKLVYIFKWPLFWRNLLTSILWGLIPSFSYLLLVWHITIICVKRKMLWSPFKNYIFLIYSKWSSGKIKTSICLLCTAKLQQKQTFFQFIREF